MELTNAIIVAGGVLILMNIVATVVLIRSPQFSNSQKWMQTLLIWVLPMVGAIVVGLLAWNELRSTSRVETDYVDREGQFSPSDVRNPHD